MALEFASLGLVLGSTAIVIGAMLIAPLMGPIVQLGMGLAIGSPFVVLRVGGRMLVSLAVSVGGAAALTSALPFHRLPACDIHQGRRLEGSLRAHGLRQLGAAVTIGARETPP